MAQGFGTVGPRSGAASSWTARGTWKDGYWDVVFSRSMSAEIEGEPALSPGLSAFLAFAVWDGSFGDRNGQKSVSVWHRLEVAP
jgi:complex iron-sulfur molybdoenzyme family reductase subunit gamma